MIRSIVRFYNLPKQKIDGISLLEQIDETPQIYYSFLVVASSGKTVDDGVASILPLTVDSSSIPGIKGHYFSHSGGGEAVYKIAIDALKGNSALCTLDIIEQRDAGAA